MGKQFSSTYQPKSNGRKPLILKKAIKDNNLSAADAACLSKYLLALTIEQLKELATNPKQAVWVKVNVKALINALIAGNTRVIRELEERAFGKPVQPIETTGEFDITILTHDEKEAEIQRLLEKRSKKENDIPAIIQATRDD